MSQQTSRRWNSRRCPLLFRCAFAVVLAGLAATMTAGGQDAPAAGPPPAVTAAFDGRDADGSGALSREEFVAGGGRPPEMLQRDFDVLDLDGDGAMTRTEFLNVPYLVPLPSRGTIPDPVMDLLDEGLQAIESSWNDWDSDRNGALAPDEFEASGIRQVVPGLETTAFTDWDRDGDGRVDSDDARLLLEIAFGVRRADGELLRVPSGRIVHFAHFQNCDQDKDDRLSREEFIPGNGNNENAATWFERADADGDGGVTLAEWRSDPGGAYDFVSAFLSFDTDLDGHIEREEFEVLPEFQQGVHRYTFDPFDTDGNGKLTLYEFQLLPEFNLVVAWHFTRRDDDGDGLLSFPEFRWGEGPAMSALRGEYFRRLDVNEDGSLDLDEWRFDSSHPDVQFRVTDADSNGSLSLEEFATVSGRTPEITRRDFQVLDLDADGGLSHAEFRNVPYLVPLQRRGRLPDPIAMLVEQKLGSITDGWDAWDRDGNGHLSRIEFQRAAFQRTVRGLEMTGFGDWDRDSDGELTVDDCRLLLELAYGVRRADGEVLRTPSGRIAQWAHFQNVDQNQDDRLSREEFVAGNGNNEFAEEWFEQADADDDGSVTFVEWRADPRGGHDCLSHFLLLDSDCDGLISWSELQAAPPFTHLLNELTFPSFDPDHDGGLSLAEYMMLPQFNLVVAWHFRRFDVDADGRLSFAEFKWNEGPAMSALRMEYFQRFDVNDDGYLDLDEWDFTLDIARSPRNLVFRQRDTDSDGRLSYEEVLGDLTAPQPGETYDPAQEAKLVWVEEAFRRADVDGDGSLSLTEFSTDDGLEAISPGSAAIDRQQLRSRGLTEVMEMEGADLRTYLIIGFNVLLIASVLAYSIVKGRRAR